jgi:predicted transcriptional regulator
MQIMSITIPPPPAISATAAADRTVLASGDFQLTDAQRREACAAMFEDVKKIADQISRNLTPIAMNGGRLGDQPEETKRAIRDQVDRALAQIAALKRQCGDVLHQGEIAQLDEVEAWLKDTQGQLAWSERTGAQIDWDRIAEGAGTVLSTLAALIGGLLSLGGSGLRYRY